ncbi:hypothetical protein WJ32_08240 [Burkholderia ubonensis]|uniref:Uncharacterized protein n=1 Tax=Burkholderia ubonensis TaxID=101571 RepID=A0A103QVM1_9BURK|nr:hypothetical protein [Burkholderia ubonensis]AOJ62447.1 hypothetical protein WJ32_08240 [Burkholderia ubonensis]KVG56410.1 hypothetical protein WJ33_36905 [Burkholderia ubonensis]
MLLDKISGADVTFRAQIETTYWGTSIGTELHPTHRCACDVLPNGWTEITWADLAKSQFFRHSPIASGWLRTKLGDARLLFMHDQIGYALIGDYWAGTVKVFRFGCKHVMESRRVGNCLHRYTCKTCGYSEVVDSSD